MVYHLKAGDKRQWGDYKRQIAKPGTWYPVDSWFGDIITEYELRTWLYVRPHYNWRHTDEFELVTPDWLKKARENGYST